MKILKFLVFISLAAFLSCGGDGDDPGGSTTQELVPEKAALIFPNNNEECNTGVQTSPSQSSVNFSWSAATNASSYQLIVVNLLNGSQLSQVVSTTNTDMVIKMNTPYKWHVISRSNSSSQTAKSEEWKFYNSGPAITSYAPFPAEVLTPSNGANLNAETVNLQWQTTDVDGDLVSFEVYFDTVNPPVESKGTTTDSFLNNVVVSPNTYYWMVKSIDAAGNSSNSEVFQFKISN